LILLFNYNKAKVISTAKCIGLQTERQCNVDELLWSYSRSDNYQVGYFWPQ